MRTFGHDSSYVLFNKREHHTFSRLCAAICAYPDVRQVWYHAWDGGTDTSPLVEIHRNFLCRHLPLLTLASCSLGLDNTFINDLRQCLEGSNDEKFT